MLSVETKEVVVKKATIQADADVFVIPNSSWIPDTTTIIGIRQVERIRSVMRANNINYDFSSDPVVELWWCSEDLRSDNIGSHGLLFTTEDDEDVYINGSYSNVVGLLPKKLFDGMTEGSTRMITIPMTAKIVKSLSGDEEIFWDIQLMINTRAAQTEYRYSRFGNFEDVLRTV